MKLSPNQLSNRDVFLFGVRYKVWENVRTNSQDDLIVNSRLCISFVLENLICTRATEIITANTRENIILEYENNLAKKTATP